METIKILYDNHILSFVYCCSSPIYLTLQLQGQNTVCYIIITFRLDRQRVTFFFDINLQILPLLLQLASVKL
jgi:hypothetical protein